jgi:hypothetical protein
MNNFLNHLKIIRTHRKFVRKACRKMGILRQGLFHDLSKYSISELRICKYYSGTRSPHDACRDLIGYSPSWIYHFHRNKHHWEFWCETTSDGVWNPIKIPYKYIIEMFCDFVGAGKAYNMASWTTATPIAYWEAKCKGKRLMHQDSVKLFESLLKRMQKMDTEQEFYDWYKENKASLKNNY